MDNLKKITAMEMVKLPEFPMDKFQKDILENLYIEFFLSNCRALITPQGEIIATGHPKISEIEDLEVLLSEHSGLLSKVRQNVVYNLSHYSALLETNSYFISLNNNLLIARFVSHPEEEDRFVIKVYTIMKDDLPERYYDKMYLGRDIFSLKTLRRAHFGLKDMRDSLEEQIIKVRERMKAILAGNEELFNDFSNEYLEEIEDTISEFIEQSTALLSAYPEDISSAQMEKSALIEVNQAFRELKHILQDIDVSLRDAETYLFEVDQTHAVRYITKFRKDITNYIYFIMAKVNGRISDSINKIWI
jgi:hypothetical protein